MKEEKLLQELSKVTEYRTLKKGEFIIRTGQVQKDIYLLDSGIARGYFLDINGKDITDCFIFRRGSAAIGFCQLELDVVSPLSIEMLENGAFYCLPMVNVIRFKETYHEILELYNHLLINSLNEHWKLKRMLNQYTAVQRYQWFLDEYPGLIERVSNKHIASFIGITPVTLSRLRKNLKERE